MNQTLLQRLTRHPRKRWRAAFAVYAIIIFTLTHWPQLQLPAGPIPRPDLGVHALVFGLWAILMVRAEWFGRHWTSHRNLWLSGAVSVLYAGVDEALQAIPFLNRFAAVDDFLANLVGVAIAMTVMAILAQRTRPNNA